MSDETPVAGDRVRVTLRTEAGSERAVHQFEGEVVSSREVGLSQTTVYRVRLPFGVANSVGVPAYKAEFDILEDNI